MSKRFPLIVVACCLCLLLALGSCDSDDPVDTNDLVAELAGLRVELACTGTGSASVNCATADVDEETSLLLGDDGVIYNVVLHFRGLVEQKSYSSPVSTDGMWIEGGTPDGSSFNIFKLEISSPPQIYYLNAGSSYIDECFVVNVQKTVVMSDSAVVTLTADAGGDALSTRNRDDQGNPIVVMGVPPYPNPFDGQFLQMDVVTITVH